MPNRLASTVLLDPQERALQRRLFLENQITLQRDLEQLIHSAETSIFDDVSGEIFAYVDQVIEDNSPCQRSFDPLFCDVLVRSIYDSIQFYKEVPHRKVGGPYFRHPTLLFHILLAAGCTDLETFLTAFDHDIPEEHLKLMQKRGDSRLEEVIIAGVLDKIQSNRYMALREFEYSPQKARSTSDACCSQINAVTKREGQLYYEYVGEIFAFSHPKLSKTRQIRCMRTKYADGTGNLLDLSSPEAALLRNDDVSDDIVVQVLSSKDPQAIKNLAKKTRYLSFPEHHPNTEYKELKGSEWMKLLYKATTIRQAERLWSLHTEYRDQVITAIPLAEVIVETAQEVIDHLCTYHCGGQRGQLTPQKVYDVYQEHLNYKKRKGYEGITPVGSHPFDGLLTRFFDTSVRGDSSYIKSLDDDRVMMLRAAFAFRELGERFHSDPTFYLKGLSETGLNVVQPALV